jgi:hypothetical protein
MPREQVIAIMGPPERREMLGDQEFLMYVTNLDLVAEPERVTPVAVQKGQVSGWGRGHYDSAVNAQGVRPILISN